MRLFSAACAIICTIATVVTYSLYSSAPDSIRGEDKSVTVSAEKSNLLYTLDINNLQFINNIDARIQIVTTAPTQKARVEALYSEQLDDYGFNIEVTDNKIALTVESDEAHPIKTFDVVIYAPVNHIEASGSGYRLEIEEPLSKNFSVYLIGDVHTTLSLGDNDLFLLASAGSSMVDVTGKSARANIAISGSSSVLAEYLVCDYAKVSISGSGLTRISVLDELHVILKKNSTLEYFGSPVVTRELVDTPSVLVQAADKVSSELN